MLILLTIIVLFVLTIFVVSVMASYARMYFYGFRQRRDNKNEIKVKKRQNKHEKGQKIFSKNDGVYVDYEEITDEK